MEPRYFIFRSKMVDKHLQRNSSSITAQSAHHQGKTPGGSRRGGSQIKHPVSKDSAGVLAEPMAKRQVRTSAFESDKITMNPMRHTDTTHIHVPKVSVIHDVLTDPKPLLEAVKKRKKGSDKFKLSRSSSTSRLVSHVQVLLPVDYDHARSNSPH